jgi:hypothetical protein
MQKRPFLRLFILFFIVSVLLLTFSGYYQRHIVSQKQHIQAEVNCNSNGPQKDLTSWYILSMHLLSLSR